MINFDEYKEKIKKIESSALIAKKDLSVEYARTHNEVKIGDIFTDHMGSILVEGISYVDTDRPSCAYKGKILGKDLTPLKSGKQRIAWQENQIKK